MSDNAENVHRLVELARIPVSVLPIASIDPDPEQPRRVERDVSGLAANMERAGQLQPVAVVSTEDGRYRLVFGEGRWLAAQSLAWTELVAHIERGRRSHAGLVQGAAGGSAGGCCVDGISEALARPTGRARALREGE